MLETIYIARHGFRQNWINDLWKSPTGTPRDPPLAAYGEKQAKELAEYITSLPEGEKPTAIFSSPFYRCVQTAAPIAESLQKLIYIENGLSEWFSPVVPGTGLHPKPPRATILASHFPSLRIDPEINWSPTCVPSRYGETVAQVHERCRQFLEAFINRLEEDQYDRSVGNGKLEGHRCVLLMTHAATAIALTRALVDDENLPMRVACCSLTILKRRERKDDAVGGSVSCLPLLGSWDIVQLARGEFLSGGLERDWGFEDVVLNGNEVILEEGVPGTEGEAEETYDLQAIPASRI